MGLMKHLYCLLWLFGLLSLINNSAAQSQSKRSSRITSSRTSFGTNVKSPSPSSSSSSNSNGVNFDCPEEFGYYPHPTDCTQYYVCVFGGALLESCTGGLMYSHELQTCDWPRNVGCEVVDSGDRDVVISKQQQQQQQPQHVPSRVRFGSSFTSPQAQQQPLQQQQQQQQVLKPTVPPQYHRQPPQVIQAQVQTIPPPPQLKVSPNPVITSRGQPKHLLDAQEEIAKLYADAHDSLPPVEEEESDRQQRVYRGQPSTVSQVQKDRDGILHQASINAIPSNDKYNSYNFGSQYRDIEYQQQQQHQQQQQQYQQPIRQSTYRPLDVFTTPAPQSAPRETYKPQPQPPRQQERPTYTNQQPLVYNSDYDEDLIAQIEQDNAYDQPTRPPPSRSKTLANKKQQQPNHEPEQDLQQQQQEKSQLIQKHHNRQVANKHQTIPTTTSTTTPTTTTKSTTLPHSSSTTTIFSSTSPRNYPNIPSQNSNSLSAHRDRSHPPNSLQDVETVYGESQNVHVQSAEPPTSYATGPRGNNNLVRSQTEKPITSEFRSKSYDIYGGAGVRSNEFVDVKALKEGANSNSSNNNKKHIKSYVISDLTPQSFKPKPTEKLRANSNKDADQEDVEILNGASSTTTLRYPAAVTYNNVPEPKPFEYKLQTGTNGFTLRAQHIEFPAETNKPIFERNPVTQYFTTPSSREYSSSTTAESSTTSTTSTASPATTSSSFRPPRESTSVSAFYGEEEEEVIDPTTYAPPMRTWRNGRPTIQSTTTSTSVAPTSPYRQPFYDYTYRGQTESSKLQSLAKEYLPRSSSTSSTTSSTSTTSTTTTAKTTTTTTRTTTPSTTTTTPWAVQTYTARASTFKDSLQKTTSPTNLRYVSPYKSLEVILQKDEKSAYSSSRTTAKPKYQTVSSTPHPFLQTTAKPLRSYFLITSPPKNLNETLFATIASNTRNFSVSDVVIGSLPGQGFRKPIAVTTTTSTTTTPIPTTTTTEESSTATISAIITTSALRVNPDKPRSRGRSRYTLATANSNVLDNDETPTTYAPRNRYRPNDVEVTTITTPAVRRKVQQRARIAALKTLRNPEALGTYSRDNKYQAFKPSPQQTEQSHIPPRAEALIATGPLVENSNSIENLKSSTDTTGEDVTVEITDRPLKYYFSNKYRQQGGAHTLADGLENAGYITSTTAAGKSSYSKHSPVLEQLKLFLIGSGDSEEENSESSSPQFVNEDFKQPEIKAAVEEIKNLYAAGQRQTTTTTTTTTSTTIPTTTTTTTLRPTTTARPTTIAYSSTSTSLGTTTHFSSSTNLYTTPSTISPSTLNTTTTLHSNSYSYSPIRYTTPTSNGQSSASSSSSGSRTIASGTTPKYYPKFPSSTFSVLSSSSTTTTTSRPPPSNNKKFSSTQPAYTATTTTTTTNTQTNTANTNSNQSGKTATVASSGASGAASPVLPPARVSRVNSALKSSIAAAAATATIPSSSSSSTLNANSAASSGGSTSARNAHNNKFSLGSAVKCSDTTSNAKCNEIPSRLNSNSNRNRGSSSSSSNSYNQGDIGSAPVTSNRGTHPPRTRPTLKPSGTIVSKAQEFIDIYKNPPSRPEPLYPQPTPDKTAAKCRKDVCLLPDCYCGGKDIPGDLNVEETPQIVLITFDDAVSMLNIELYEELFNNETRKNPNGCPIRGTFYVSHEWTDYGMVQDLYADGHELASHTVSHSFGEQFSQKKWTREVAGQREILAAYGGVKLSDVRGMRAPFLSVGGNKMFKMLYDSNFTYDSSMPVYENRPPSWPYTLDYKIFHDCMIPPCPTKSYPGVWQVPMVMWQDLNGGRCSMGDACSNPSEAEGVTKMIMKNFERHYTTNRAPFGLFYHAAWFTQPHHKEGFIKFLDTINAMPDVWIVTNWQALQWVRDPTPLSRINSFQPFQCDYSDRPKRCNNPKVCNLWHKSGVRYMKTCQPCPDIYPWTGKTGIRSSRIDNDIEDSTA
ncbi:chitin deacetylase-like 5 isoform X5 [Musca autumnalis]|uniref:chitin deacetylase-like 5 isoform X5 n=1 Tax=Musca autumnalis TaxID=221902 RepID=UPI003CE97D1F